MNYMYEHPRAAVTVDCCVFGIDFGIEVDFFNPRLDLKVLLVKRGPKEDAYENYWALPGGYVNAADIPEGEDLDQAAHRSLKEKAGITVSYLEQLYTFGNPHRDPRGRVISVAYYALVRSRDYVAKPGTHTTDAAWFSMSNWGQEVILPLAFDHRTILGVALQRLQGKIRYAPLGFNLLPPRFTIPELMRVYEAVLQRNLPRSNFVRFARKLRTNGILIKVGQQEKVSHRPGDIYRFDKRAYDKAVRDGFNLEL
jgi:8-oxo-dGTP diphosphatase